MSMARDGIWNVELKHSVERERAECGGALKREREAAASKRKLEEEQRLERERQAAKKKKKLVL